MKQFPSRIRSRSAGFTLVEILVVIAIIAILASVTIVGVTSALNAAKRTKANNTATQIQTAVLAYYTEYGTYPTTTTATDTYYDDNDLADWKNLVYALSGNINPYTAATTTSSISNTRQIPFMTPKKSDVDTNGVLINPFKPANNPYFYVSMDSDYSGVLGDTGTPAPDFTAWKTGSTQGGKTTKLTQGVAVWCDCDTGHLPPGEAASTAPSLWVHTY